MVADGKLELGSVVVEFVVVDGTGFESLEDLLESPTPNPIPRPTTESKVPMAASQNILSFKPHILLFTASEIPSFVENSSRGSGTVKRFENSAGLPLNSNPACLSTVSSPPIAVSCLSE